MSIKISELPQASTVNNTDVIPIVQGGTTKKAPAGLIHPTIATTINSTSTNNEVAGAKAVYDNSLDVYSTTEQRVGTWIDGKPLYQKTLVVDYTMTNNAYSNDMSISSMNIDFMVNIQSCVKKTFSATNSDYEATWYWTDTDKCRVFYRKSNTSDNETLRFRISGTNTGGTFYITLTYTKTTD